MGPAAAAVALLLAPAPVGAGSKGKRDPRDARGPLDIARAKISQSGPRLALQVKTYGSWKPGSLKGDPDTEPGSPHSYLCLEVARKSSRSRTCLTATSKGQQRLYRVKIARSGKPRSKPKPIDASIEKRGGRAFAASFPFRELGLRPGRYGWQVISGWGDPSCADPDPGPLEPVPPDAEPPVAEAGAAARSNGPNARCTDQVPNGKFAKAKLRRPRIVGCTHGGPLVRRAGSSKGKRVALTFDDGPSSYTSRVIKILDQRGAKGTFFVVGQEISGRQGVLRRALSHGHEIGNHTMRHSMLPSTSDMRATSATIKRATGFRPCTFRPPGGALNLSVARGARSAGMTTIMWDVDTRDWTTPGAGAIRSRATSVRSGSIVLMHDGGGNRSQTVAALPGIISELKGRGYELVTVTRLLGERPIWKP